MLIGQTFRKIVILVTTLWRPPVKYLISIIIFTLLLVHRALTAEEKERKRKEMMENASWRDEQREKNVKRYAEEAAKEEKETHKGSSSDFIK